MGALRKVSLFTLWYVANVVYNDTNKTLLRGLRLPLTMASLQLGIGLLFIVPLWLSGLRAPPRLRPAQLRSLLVPALVHAAGQMVTVASLGAGSLGFVNAVKSAEPLSTAALGAFLFGDLLPWQVNACLLPICAGVALASSADLHAFNYECFVYAMLSNLFFSLRGVLTKRVLAASTPATALGPSNLLAVVTALAFLMTIPLALAVEGPTLEIEWSRALSTGKQTGLALLLHLLLSGASFHLYNEASFAALGLVHPLTHAVGNAAKRPLLVLYSVARGGAAMRGTTVAGSGTAVAGLIMYALAKQLYDGPGKKGKSE